MNDVSESQKRLNWPGIDMSIRHFYDFYAKREHKSILKKCYLKNEDVSDFPTLLRLVVRPNASYDDWGSWKEEKALDSYLRLHQNYSIYFGNNSLLNGRDSEIYEYFHSDARPINLRKGSTFSEVMKPGFEKLVDYFGSIKINPYHQLWRGAQEVVKSLAINHDREFAFDSTVDTEALIKYLCPIAWAQQHSDKFDGNLESVSTYFYQFFTTEMSGTKLGDAFLNTVDRHLNEYAEGTGAGGYIYSCIRYESEEQLNAARVISDPTTRFPYGDGLPEATVRCLPFQTRATEDKISANMIQTLWRAGFQVHSSEVIGNTKLILKMSIPLGRRKLFTALGTLSRNAVNIEERLLSKKTLPGDSMEDESMNAPVVYLVEPLVGSWRVGALPVVSAKTDWQGPFHTELLPGIHKDIDTIVEQPNRTEALAELADRYEFIREKGNPIFPSWYLDGYTLAGL